MQCDFMSKHTCACVCDGKAELQIYHQVIHKLVVNFPLAYRLVNTFRPSHGYLVEPVC